MWRRSSSHSRGSPPRARGTPCRGQRPAGRLRITPACAGNTGPRSVRSGGGADHPRVRGEHGYRGSGRSSYSGSPPRARGTLSQVALLQQVCRITPACAGNTRRRRSGHGRQRDHPRVRGEHETSRFHEATMNGSPPRARGTHPDPHQGTGGEGITPACAGNTAGHTHTRSTLPDHPRVRGEHWFPRASPHRRSGSPPRARGTRDRGRGRPAARRITPACAGNTPLRSPPAGPDADHPRVRGEHTAPASPRTRGGGSPPRARGTHDEAGDAVDDGRITPACAGNTAGSPCNCAAVRGSPPRARGTPAQLSLCLGQIGITPACAGNTRQARAPCRRATDHPRVRGEHPMVTEDTVMTTGSPPRARGTRLFRRALADQLRITPACAGNTPDRQALSRGMSDHPRVRGEHLKPGAERLAQLGSPPRARGTRCRRAVGIRSARITPACAGNTAQQTCTRPPPWDHPRVRGEHAVIRQINEDTVGSPPRARGTLLTEVAAEPCRGITPACAGNTHWKRR